MMTPASHVPFGLVLGGGGARGLAHCGVLRALEHLGYRPAMIAGVSMGAIVGATYSLNPNWYDDLLATDMSGFPDAPDFHGHGLLGWLSNVRGAERVITGMVFGWGLAAPIVDWGRARLRRLTRDADLRDGRIPVVVAATDLEEGERVLLCEGPAADALYASSAIAGVLPPARIGGRLLVDGGYSDIAPVDVIRQAGINTVIAVDASTSLHGSRPVNGLTAMLRAVEICQNEHAHLRFAEADLVIQPVLEPPVDVLDFSQLRRCAAAGARCTMSRRADLTDLLCG